MCGKSYMPRRSPIIRLTKMSEKPTTAFIISLIGGIFVLLGSLIWATLGTFLALLVGFGFLLYAFLVFGIIILIGALMINSNPRSAHTWGIILIILGIFSLVGITTTLGGILSIIGGALAVSWKPTSSSGFESPPPPPAASNFCPTCGGPLRYVAEYQRWYCVKEQKYI